MRILTADEARRLDKKTIDAGTPGIVLMERAASGVVHELERLLECRPSLGRRILAVCGTGNNGGDGFEVAARLHRSGRWVETLLTADPGKISGDALLTFDRMREAGVPTAVADQHSAFEKIRHASLIVDALFGTGLARPVEPSSPAGMAIAAMNASGGFKVAIDLPSGLDASRGEVIGPAVHADLTVTFGFPKPAHVFLPAAGLCSRLVVAGIGLLDASPVSCPLDAVTGASVARMLEPRAPAAHKGVFGTAGIAGGSAGMAGAPGLAARAAHRAGAGKVVVFVPDAIRDTVHILSPESTTASLEASFGEIDALAVGPGLGQSPDALASLRRCLAFGGPVVVDADGLNLLALNPRLTEMRRGPLVLTPHPGEAARLLGHSVREIQESREEAARELASKFQAVVILKGFRSLAADPEGHLSVVLSGNPGMASGGMGDSLTGIVTGLLARGLEPFDAARAGAWLHGTAGDLAMELLGGENVLASDVTSFLPKAFESLRFSRLD